MSRVRVESAAKIEDMSRVSRITLIVIWVRVESTGYCLNQSWVADFTEEKTSRFCIYLYPYRKRTSLQLHLTAPPPGQQLFTKLGKMWWFVSQIWLNSDSNELIQSWVRLVNLVLSWVGVESPGLSYGSESSHPEKNESSTTLHYSEESIF